MYDSDHFVQFPFQEVFFQDYVVEILEQPILEELEIRIEFAEIRTCDDDSLEHSQCEKPCRRTVVEEILTEQRLPERSQCFWSYIGIYSSNLW